MKMTSKCSYETDLTACVFYQDERIIDDIARYFNHEIPAVPAHDEENFIEVLKNAGLTDG